MRKNNLKKMLSCTHDITNNYALNIETRYNYCLWDLYMCDDLTTRDVQNELMQKLDEFCTTRVVNSSYWSEKSNNRIYY